MKSWKSKGTPPPPPRHWALLRDHSGIMVVTKPAQPQAIPSPPVFVTPSAGVYGSAMVVAERICALYKRVALMERAVP